LLGFPESELLNLEVGVGDSALNRIPVQPELLDPPLHHLVLQTVLSPLQLLICREIGNAPQISSRHLLKTLVKLPVFLFHSLPVEVCRGHIRTPTIMIQNK
jgi:hypothetical protein